MQQQRPADFNYHQMVDRGTNLFLLFLSAVTLPVEQILRPFYGSMYFAPSVHLFSALLMLALPMISAMFSSVPALFLAAHIHQPQALFTIGSFSKLFFLLLFIHVGRTAWLRFDLSREEHSEFEGPALLPIRLLPWGNSFWICRILVEPLVVTTLALFMRRIMVFDALLSNYLLIAALCLAMKQYLSWHRAWAFLRRTLDAKYAGPIIATLLDDKASSKDFEKIHLVSFPKNTPPDLRRAAVEHLVRVVSQSDYPTTPGGNNAANG